MISVNIPYIEIFIFKLCKCVSFYQGPLFLEFNSKKKLKDHQFYFRTILKLGNSVINYRFLKTNLKNCMMKYLIFIDS